VKTLRFGNVSPIGDEIGLSLQFRGFAGAPAFARADRPSA
jgi:hypothetical protein